jgi:hypothetical protein
VPAFCERKENSLKRAGTTFYTTFARFYVKKAQSHLGSSVLFSLL